MRPLVATIHPSAVAANLRLARERAAPARVLAVIKANAYGHGIARVLPALDQADGLALLELDAAVRVRESGYAGALVLLEGCFAAEELDEVAARGLAMVVHQLNTGMNRLGFMARELAAAKARLEASGKARVSCVLTHLARADEGEGIDEQVSRYEAACAALGGGPFIRSLANSAALLRRGALGGDQVRPGIMLYGGSPYVERNGAELGLRPAMSLASEIIAVQELTVGEQVGYGGLFAAGEPTRVGVVACGYADGYPRHASTGTPIAVCGKRTRLLGRVSMDMIAVDLTPVPEASVGSPVELWGDIVSVDEVARAAGTIGYELLCAVAPRVVKRVAAEDSDINGLGWGVEACI